MSELVHSAGRGAVVRRTDRGQLSECRAGHTREVITGEYIGGYRIVRTLGVGSRAQVFLGHGGEDRVAAIKVFGSAASPLSIDTEIGALVRADHAHSLQLRDVASAGDGLPCLVLERLGHESLAHLLAGRSALLPGEAVTVLAPLVAAIDSLHGSGVVHGAISAGSVMFRETGAPVLVGFGHATLLADGVSPVLMASSRVVLEDRIALGRLAATVLSRVQSPGASELLRWLSTAERDGFPDNFAGELEHRVFDLGVASPVRFNNNAGDRAPVRLPQRVHTAEPLATAEVLVPVPDWSLAGLRASIEARLRALRVPNPRSLRRPVWVAVAAGLAALVIALAVIPDGGEGEAAPQPLATAATAAPGAVGGDDPAAALQELLQARESCLRDLSVLCLENAVQSGSAAMDDDVALIRAIEAGTTSGSLAGDAMAFTLVERNGDAALVSYTTGPNSEPASVLLVKGEAGWRMRDYVAG